MKFPIAILSLLKSKLIKMKRISLLMLFLVVASGSLLAQQKIRWNKDGAKMVLIPAGSFEMGDHLDNMGDALPVHILYGCERSHSGAV